MVTALMGADLNSILKCQKLTDEHVQFLVYQILRGLKVCNIKTCRNPLQHNPQELKKARQEFYLLANKCDSPWVICVLKLK